MEFVGLRPGEKLHEELFYDAERVQPTEVAKILRAMAEPPPASVRDDVRGLLAMATGGGEDDLRRGAHGLRPRIRRPALARCDRAADRRCTPSGPGRAPSSRDRDGSARRPSPTS